MARPGKKPLSTEEKKARGTLQSCREVEGATVLQFPVVSEVPDPPDWINKEAVKVWKELAPILHKNEVLTVVDINAFAGLCQLQGEIIDDCRCTKRVTAATWTQMRHLYEAFGLTPGSRGRVTQSKEGDNGSKFNKNKKAPPPPGGKKGKTGKGKS